MDRLVTVLLAAGLGSAALALLRRQGRRTKKTRVALVDNGSLKPEATKSLRRLAAALSERSKLQVDAVSARFADRIKAKDLDGKKGEVLEGWFKRIHEEDPQTEVRLLPLLIGPSDTLTKAMPESAKKVSALQVEIAPPLVSLCPALFGGQESGALQLAEMLRSRLEEIDLGPEDTVLLCDHGSPVQRVANAKMAVREALATAIGREVVSCCMERREGEAYDFNGELLQTVLLALPHGAIAKVALLFLQEGRHAGPGGDIEQIVAGAMEKRPDLSIRTTSVLAGHSLLEDLLLKRLEQSIPLRVFH
ncbi:unnamed protein product [Cladocopium goreaui]|uniref:Cobalamin biosynthesis protein CbiX n=1 Tax=Cladocopium goreaui TaxID=2562237 RepID=A0A9P1M553_9DINO|nr:unnamed protein product [Cladocopium goreaui]